MTKLKQYEVWFITGSQHLYGKKTLEQVEENSRAIARALDGSEHIPVKIRHKALLTGPDEIAALMREANGDGNCIGLIAWMHTFSPAKMWIGGLNSLHKPLCHLHTQFNAGIPWESIDMDFMNLNQSAHGDREFGFIVSRMRKKRKIVAGHWQTERVQKQLGGWCRVALGWHELQNLRVARIGDNMRQVAVTEGDKVEAQIRFGFSVNGYDHSDVTKLLGSVSENELNKLLEEYESHYEMAPKLRKGGEQRTSLIEAARIEIALRRFLDSGGFKAFTDTFENLGAFKQLPGIAVQRLMADGYGFGAEGDWKTAAMLRAMKVMSTGLQGGNSFMEDYTYNFTEKRSTVLGAHMLEICPSIAKGKPSCEVHPLGIGGKEDPVRLVFTAPPGDAINVSLLDMGNRFRLLVNEVETLSPEKNLPRLPVARVLWDPKPDLEIAATAWILAGGAHHTVFSQALTTGYMEDFADIAGIELLVIDGQTRIRDFKDRINANEVYYHLFQHNL